MLCLRLSLLNWRKLSRKQLTSVLDRQKGLKTPGTLISERRQHELTHLPYRDWCPLCVKAKGRHGASKKIVDRQPVIQIDYSYHATHKELPLQKILSACDVQTGLRLAVVVPSKVKMEYAKAELKKFIYECGRTFGAACSSMIKSHH